MKAQWETIEQLETEFDLTEADGDLRKMRRILRSRLKDVHPDKSEGKFESGGDEAEFHRTKAAIEFVDNVLLTGVPRSNQQALLVATEFSDAIIRSFGEARDKDRELERTRQLNEKQKRISDEIEAEVRKKYFFLKAAAGVFAFICGFLTLFPDKFAAHPVFLAFNEFIERLDFTLGVLTLYLFVASGAAIVYFWWEEQRELKHKKECLSDKGIERLMKSKTFEGKLGPLGNFTRADLIEALEEQRISKDHNILNEVAGLIIDKLINRGAAKRVFVATSKESSL
jgi:hypothetical protein